MAGVGFALHRESRTEAVKIVKGPIGDEADEGNDAAKGIVSKEKDLKMYQYLNTNTNKPRTLPVDSGAGA